MVLAIKGGSQMDELKRELKDEFSNPAKRSANLKLFRALAVFIGGVIVARNFGEALFVS